MLGCFFRVTKRVSLIFHCYHSPPINHYDWILIIDLNIIIVLYYVIFYW